MTSEAIAGELRLPLFVIRLEALITRFMGETAAKLRLVFNEVNRRRGVYLFDEFDAVGGRRDASNDVGEMRRVLNSFLQFMEEQNATDSIVISATNHPELLDRALLRRFDDVLQFEFPSDAEIRAILETNLRPLKHVKFAWNKILEMAQGLSQAELVNAAEEAVKTAILEERDNVSSKQLVAAIETRRAMRNALTSI